MAAPQLTFPLRAKRRLVGLAYGAMHSVHRGTGSDVAGSRPYRPGDDIKSIDWRASAKLSRARGTDEFVVREHYADEAPRVVVVCDKRPSMSLFPRGWPWLRKPEAIRTIIHLIADSALAAQAYTGYLDYGAGTALWRPPKSQRTLHDLDWDPRFGAPEDALARGLQELIRHKRDVPAGAFVFLVSDFLVVPPRELWLTAVARRWDIVPVIVQDRIWEQSFPDVSGIVLPFADPADGARKFAELTRRETERRVNEGRRAQLIRGLRSFDLEPVLVEASDVQSVLSAFVSWVDRRAPSQGHAC